MNIDTRGTIGIVIRLVSKVLIRIKSHVQCSCIVSIVFNWHFNTQNMCELIDLNNFKGSNEITKHSNIIKRAKGAKIKDFI